MSYASSTAINRANAIGLSLALADWRDIFLAITDEIASDPPTTSHVAASYVGPVRDGAERWRIKIPGREFDAIYDPHVARIVLVLGATPFDPEPAILPKPTPPLKGNTAERTLENV